MTVEPYYQLEIFASAGARISLPRLSVMDGGVDAYAYGPGSVIDLPGLQGLLRHPKAGSASLEARNGGSVLMPQVTALDRINLLLRDTGFITLTQLTAFTQAKLTLDQATVTLPALTDLNSSSLLAEHGARLTLPSVTELVRTNSATLTLTAQDPGSVLSLPNVTANRLRIGSIVWVIELCRRG